MSEGSPPDVGSGGSPQTVKLEISADTRAVIEQLGRLHARVESMTGVTAGNAPRYPARAARGRCREPVLIGLCSRAMGSGKSAVADRLVHQHGFVLLKFAGPLKAMTRALLAELGEDSVTIERRVEGDLKESVIPALKQTCRYVMQRLGTEFGRVCLHENVWAEIVRERATKLLAAGQSVVIDDMRYMNELDALLSIGGSAWRVERPGVTVTASHSSEGELDPYDLPTLRNNFATLEQLHRHIDSCWLPQIAA